MINIGEYRPRFEAEQPPKGELEQAERLRQSLNLVQQFTRQAGRELPIVPVVGVADIPDVPGVYVLSEDIGKEIKDTNFVLTPSLLSGTRDSGHAVISGQMSIERAGEKVPQEIDIAAKCFMKRSSDERRLRAKREIQVMQKMEEEGKLTFTPRCLVIGKPDSQGESSVAIMTEFDRSIMSLDNHPWSVQSSRNLALAAQATNALGQFNASGMFHGDAKIKNVAQDDTGNFGMIDFETSSDIDPANPYDASSCATTDLHKLFDSLQDRGFFPKDARARSSVIDTLTQSYLDAWQTADPDVQSAVLMACAEVQNAFQTMNLQRHLGRVAS